MRKLYYILFPIPTIVMILLATGLFMFSAKGYGFSGVSPTGSMYPTIKTGDRVLINWNVESFIHRNLTGEVIVFGEMKICHRVILDEGEWLHTRGDAYTTGGEHLTRDEIKGLFIQVSQDEFMEMLRYGWTG